MRRITKGAEPDCLRQVREHARRHAPGTWDLKECRDAVVEALCREQHYLCAYCMGRIEPGTLHVEHFIARSSENGTHVTYTWSNLLGVCPGTYQDERTCDVARGDQVLHVHPAGGSTDPERTFLARHDGTLECQGHGNVLAEDAVADAKVLNLEAKHLLTNRKAVVARLRRELKEDDSEGRIRKLYSAYVSGARLPPYCTVAARYLEGKARAHGFTLP